MLLFQLLVQRRPGFRRDAFRRRRPPLADSQLIEPCFGCRKIRKDHMAYFMYTETLYGKVPQLLLFQRSEHLVSGIDADMRTVRKGRRHIIFRVVDVHFNAAHPFVFLRLCDVESLPAQVSADTVYHIFGGLLCEVPVFLAFKQLLVCERLFAVFCPQLCKAFVPVCHMFLLCFVCDFSLCM